MIWLTHGELLINVVMRNKPKVPTGLNQKVRGWDQRLPIPLTQTTKPPAERQSLTHPGTHAERGKPASLPTRVHLLQKSRTERRVQEDGESKGRSVMERIRGATSLDAKAGRLPSGLSSQERLAKRQKEGKQMTGATPRA